jgi:hypothetical protein
MSILYKLNKIFESQTINSQGLIKDKEHLNHLLKKLIERQILIQHDIPLIEKYIIGR